MRLFDVLNSCEDPEIYPVDDWNFDVISGISGLTITQPSLSMAIHDGDTIVASHMNLQRRVKIVIRGTLAYYRPY